MGWFLLIAGQPAADPKLLRDSNRWGLRPVALTYATKPLGSPSAIFGHAHRAGTALSGTALEEARERLRALTQERLAALTQFADHLSPDAAPDFDETRRLRVEMDDLVAQWTVAYHEFERQVLRLRTT